MPTTKKPKKRSLKSLVGPVKGPAQRYSRNDREALTKWEYDNGVVMLKKDGTYKWVPKP